jgi:hypothetical protein
MCHSILNKRMTLLNHEQVAQYEGFCYQEIVEDIGLQDEFKS